MAVAGCGGGGSDPTLTAEAQTQRDQTAAVVQAQQSAAQLMSAVVKPGSGTENFEAGMGDWRNWGNAQVVAGAGVSGSSALQVGPAAGGAALKVPDVVGGTTYRLTAQVRVTDPVNGPTTLGVDFYNASGARIVGTRAPSNVTNTSYAAFSYDVTAPVGTAYALAWVWKNGSTGFAYVDDVTFGAASAPPPPPPPPTGSNLMSNGGFEAGMTGWTDWGNTQVTGQAHSGTSALVVGTAAGGAGYKVDGIVPGTSYRLGASAKVSDASEKVFVGVNFVDAAGSLVGSTQRSTSSTGYTPISADILAPPGAARAVVYVWKNGGSGFGYVDDFAFGAVATPAPMFPTSTNLVAFGDFAGGLAGWQNWGNATSVHSDGPIQVGTDAGGFGQRIAGIVPGQTYRLTAQVSVSIAGETGYLGLKFLDAAGTSVQDQVVPFTSTTTSSTQVELLAPANAATALVYVWKNAGAGLALVDDVSLVTVAPAKAPSPLIAQPISLVNTNTAGDQETRVIGATADGGYTVVWYTGQSLAMRHYDSKGHAAGPETALRAGTDAVAVLEDGSVVIAYASTRSTQPENAPYVTTVGLYLQRFGPDGAQIVPETTISSFIEGDPRRPTFYDTVQVLPMPGGGYVVGWRTASTSATVGLLSSFQTLYFDSHDQRAGAPVYVDTLGATYVSARMVADSLGGYTVYWSGVRREDFKPTGLHVAHFSQTQGTVKVLSGWSGSALLLPLQDGRYVLYTKDEAGSVAGVFLDSNGAPQAPATPLPAMPVLASLLADGTYLEAWPTGTGELAAQRFDAQGKPIGDVLALPADAKQRWLASALQDGGFAAAWSAIGSAGDLDVYTQAFLEPPASAATN